MNKSNCIRISPSTILVQIYQRVGNYGSYKGVIKREAVYKCTNKDYLPEA